MAEYKKEGLWLWLVPTETSVIELSKQRGKINTDYYIHNFPFHLTLCPITCKNSFLLKYFCGNSFNNIIELNFKKRVKTDNLYNSITYIPTNKNAFISKLSYFLRDNKNIINDQFDPHVSIVYNFASIYDGQKLDDNINLKFDRLAIGYSNEKNKIWSIL